MYIFTKYSDLSFPGQQPILSRKLGKEVWQKKTINKAEARKAINKAQTQRISRKVTSKFMFQDNMYLVLYEKKFICTFVLTHCLCIRYLVSNDEYATQ